MSFIHFLQHDPHSASQAPRPSWGDGTAEPETVHRIAGRLSELDPLRAAFLAGVGYCLARVVAADLAVTDSERAEMVNQVEAFAAVPAEEAQLIVDLAVHEALAGAGTDDFYVTQRVRALATPDELEHLLHCLFAVAAPGDETISFEENRTIREISDELGFTLPSSTRCAAPTPTGWPSSAWPRPPRTLQRPPRTPSPPPAATRPDGRGPGPEGRPRERTRPRARAHSSMNRKGC